jgi:hypothetical protein
VNRRSPEQQSSQWDASDTARTGSDDNRIVDDDDAVAACSANANCPGSLGGPSAAMKTRRSSFDSSPGHSYAGKVTWCDTSLSKKQFPASILVALARHSSVLTSRLVRLQLPARLKNDLLARGAKARGS